jgi:inositol 1,4,5-triphosphate receptor type 3
LLSLLPEDVLRPGQDYEEVKPMKEWVYYPPTVRSFDQILERPFLEVLLLTLYFTQNSELENRLVELLELYATQKNEFV